MLRTFAQFTLPLVSVSETVQLPWRGADGGQVLTLDGELPRRAEGEPGENRGERGEGLALELFVQQGDAGGVHTLPGEGSG